MKPVMKNDSAVSEIIGAILLFAIASVLLTSFILWYVPSTGTNNDITYQSQTQQSFSSLDSKLLSPSLTPGSSISQSMPLGISGVPPFSPSQSTNLYYNKNFNASMSYKGNVVFENAVPIKNLKIDACANSTSNNIRNNIYASSQFTYSIIFAESGLPSGQYWTVSLGGSQKSAGSVSGITSYITYSLPRGSYSYTVTTNAIGYNPNPSSGTVNVNTSGKNVGISFSSGNINGMVAAAEGPNSQVNDVNQTNFISIVTQKGIIDVQYENYWLNNSSQSISNLSSQEFFVYHSSTPVDNYQYLIEPNMVFYEQMSQGNATIYSSIGTQPWGGNLSGTSAVTYISTNQLKQSHTGIVNVNLKKSILLDSGTYYLNIWEAVNENVNNVSYNNNSGNYYLKFDNNLTSIGAESNYGYGYGPNEFIGTITNPSIDVSVGYSYYYSATIDSCKHGDKHTDFSVQKENLRESSTPYFFKIGYSPPHNSTTFPLTIIEKHLPIGSTWNITINNTVHTSTVNSSGGNTITVDCPGGIFPYQVSKVGTYLSNRSNGYIQINTSSGAVNQLEISFFQPVGSLPYSWDISNSAMQQFKVTGTKNQTINFVSLYFFNYTIGPASYTGNQLNYTVNIQILNSKLGSAAGNSSVFSYSVTQTGWTQIFFNNTTGFQVSPGTYYIKVTDVGGSNNAIGLGFTTTGGYSNYFQRVCTNFLSSSINDIRNVTLTPFYGGNPIPVFNSSLVYQVGFYNVTTSEVKHNLIFEKNFKIIGSIEATGNTQFSIQETYALQDGIIITAGKGVTYVTVNPLPISISNTSNGTLALSSIGYNISMAKSVATSISGYGSTIVSATMENQTSHSYTVNNTCVIDSVFAKVLNITLLEYNYTINSAFSKYWANTFFVELVGSSMNENYTNFNVFKQFNFLLNGNIETVSINQPVDLSTINLNTVSVEINSM